MDITKRNDIGLVELHRDSEEEEEERNMSGSNRVKRERIETESDEDDSVYHMDLAPLTLERSTAVGAEWAALPPPLEDISDGDEYEDPLLRIYIQVLCGFEEDYLGFLRLSNLNRVDDAERVIRELDERANDLLVFRELVNNRYEDFHEDSGLLFNQFLEARERIVNRAMRNLALDHLVLVVNKQPIPEDFRFFREYEITGLILLRERWYKEHVMREDFHLEHAVFVLRCERETVLWFYDVHRRHYCSEIADHKRRRTRDGEQWLLDHLVKHRAKIDHVLEYRDNLDRVVQEIQVKFLSEVTSHRHKQAVKAMGFDPEVSPGACEILGVDEGASAPAYYDNPIHVALDAMIVALPYATPEVNKSGLSDLILFVRGVYAASGKHDVVMACANLANVLQVRFGHDVFRTEIDHYLFKYVVPLFSAPPVDDFESVVLGVKVEKPAEGAAGLFNSYVAETTEKMREFVESNKPDIKLELPEWNSDWMIYISTMRNSKLYEACMNLIKYATGLFALLTFLDKDKAKEMMDNLIGEKWFDQVKLFGSASLVIYGVFCIYKEVTNIQVRATAGLPWFEVDELIALHEVADRLYARLDDKLSDVELDSLNSKILSTKLSRDFDDFARRLERYKMKNIGSLKPEIRRSLESLNSKAVRLEHAVTLDFNASNSNRNEPYSYCILGTPGIGKSVLAEDIHYLLADALGKPSDLSNRYIIDVHSKYDDTYRRCMWHTLFDDYASSNPEKDPDAANAIKRPISIVNTVPCPAVKADVDSKGKMYINSDVVGFTTNNPYTPIKAVMMTPNAILRRMGLIIQPVLQKGYEDESEESKLNFQKWNEQKRDRNYTQFPWKFKLGRYANTGKNVIVPLKGKPSGYLYSFPEFAAIIVAECIEKCSAKVEKYRISTDKCKYCGKYMFADDHEDCDTRGWSDGDSVVLGVKLEEYEVLVQRAKDAMDKPNRAKVGPVDSLVKKVKELPTPTLGNSWEWWKTSFNIDVAALTGCNFAKKVSKFDAIEFSTQDRIYAFFAYIVLTLVMVFRRIFDNGVNELTVVFSVALSAILYSYRGADYVFFGLLGFSLYVLWYLKAHNEVTYEILLNTRSVHFNVWRYGVSNIRDKWTLFQFLDPRAASIISVMGKVLVVVAVGYALKGLVSGSDRVSINGVQEVKDMDDNKFRRIFWRNATIATAVAAAAYFVASKSFVSEISTKQKLEAITVVGSMKQVKDGKEEFVMRATGYLYGNSVNFAKHSVLGHWLKSGLLDDSGDSVIKIQSAAGTFNKRVAVFNIKYSDIVFDDFDTATIRIFEHWGSLPRQLEALYLDAPADVSLELVGVKGYVLFPLRDEFVEVQFVEAKGDLMVDEKYGSWFGHRYINKRGFKKLQYILGGETVAGDCHSPVVAVVNGKLAIVGLHTQLDFRENLTFPLGAAITMTVETLKRLDAECTKRYVESHNGFPGSMTPLSDVEVKDVVHEKSPFVTIDEPHNVLPIGQIADSFRPKMDSRVQKSLLYDDFIDDLKATGEEFGPPVMEGRLVDGVWVGPYDKIVKSTAPNDTPLNAYKLEEAALEYMEDVTRPDEDLSEFNKIFRPGFLTVEEAINGIGKGGDIWGMNLKTSSGQKLPGKKHDYLRLDVEKSASAGRDWYVPTALLAMEVQYVQDQFEEARRDMITPTVRTHLKDEIRKKGKKARPFYISDFAYLIVMRMMLSPVLWWLRNNKLRTECYVGTNCASPAWRALARHLLSMGDSMIDSDFEMFDLINKREYQLCLMYNVYVPVAKFLGYDERSLETLMTACVADAFTFLAVNGDLFLTDGFNPSGKMDTVERNCTFNSVLDRYVFNELKVQFSDTAKLRYRDNVAAGTYGDDGLKSVHERARKFFNFISIRDCLAKYSIKITPAKKEDGDYLHKPLSKCQFLKRSFVEAEIILPDGEFRDLTLAPLEMSSILKSIVWQNRSKEVTTQVQSRATLESANREMWMHGPEVFGEYYPRFIEASRKLGFVRPLETYDEITLAYITGAYCTEQT